MVIFVHYPLATNYGSTFNWAVTNKAGDSHEAMSHDTTTTRFWMLGKPSKKKRQKKLTFVILGGGGAKFF